MPDRSFATITRRLSRLPSRRDILRGLAGAGLGLGIARFPDEAEAKKKRKKRRKKTKKAKPNAFGCLSVGKICKHADQCCSGICQGKKGKRQCKAHGTGTCDQDGPDLCTTTDTALVVCNSSNDCGCIRTTARSAFCFDTTQAVEACADCTKDADCAALGFPPGSACAPVSTGICAGFCAGGMACMAPCGDEPPEL